VLPGVQTCRGSHTHTLVTDPDDPDNIYVYNSGTAGMRSPMELAGCENAALAKDPVTTGNLIQWRRLDDSDGQATLKQALLDLIETLS
jgi:hypothetical protein